ncbi:MAG: pyridoxal phosphate-dependent aminotransferase family protein [Bacteroidota bacterium]|nr:pyridoxal phosphate-dependent aminotransferase family protein [Bacteroidota bacterium]
MDKLIHKLNTRHEEDSFRTLPKQNNLIDFCSNDYLGLARNPELFQLIEKRFKQADFQNKLGATGSRLISGNCIFYEQLEEKLRVFFKGESALIFNSGYAANTGVLSSVPQKGDTILYDELCHSSIKDGIRLSFAEKFAFRHNDITDLEKKIKNAQGTIFIVIESIYSMDGDEASIIEITNIAKKYQAYIIVDEAHSTGVYGPMGEGLCVDLNIEKDICIRIHTFGKGMGVHGAVVICSRMVKDFLINFSRPFIYATALPFHSLVSIDCAFEFLQENIYLKLQLENNIALFKSVCNSEVLKMDSDSPIQVIIIGDVKETKKISNDLQNNRLWVKPILSPTVKKGTERLRICLHQFNSKEDILLLSNILNSNLKG